MIVAAAASAGAGAGRRHHLATGLWLLTGSAAAGSDLTASVATQASRRPASWHLSASYIGDSFANVAGGQSRGATYQGRLGLIGDADLGALLGWRGASAHFSVHQIHGVGVTERRVGALLTITGIEAEPATRLFNLWIEQAIGDAITIRAGQFTADQEFVISDTAATFVNSTFGWPAILAQDLPSGGPAYPLATPGLRIDIKAGNRTRLLAAIFNGDPAGRGPGDPQQRDRHGLNSLSPAGPPFLIAEARYRFGESPGSTLRAGIWSYRGSADDQRYNRFGRLLADPRSFGDPLRHRGNTGGYAILDVVRHRAGGATVNAFLRLAGAASDRNPISVYVDTGIAITGLSRRRPDDTAGIAIGYARISPAARAHDGDLRRFQDRTAPLRDHEAVVELTYQAHLTRHWIIQPNLQLVLQPGGSSAVRNALVVGIRNAVNF